MPGYNVWVPRTNAFLGNQLEHFPGKQSARHFVAGRVAERAGNVGSAVGGAIGFAGAYGARRFGQWYYPSEKIAVRRKTYMPTKTKKKRRRKTCCKLIKGKKVCKPRYCSKNKYWY